MDNNEKIKKGKNILRIKLKGKKYDTSSFDLMKIPVEWLYREALYEIGEQESYIEELKATIQTLQDENEKLKQGLLKVDNRELRLAVKREEFYAVQQSMLSNERKKNKELKNRVNELISQVVSYQNKVIELQKQLNEIG